MEKYVAYSEYPEISWSNIRYLEIKLKKIFYGRGGQFKLVYGMLLEKLSRTMNFGAISWKKLKAQNKRKSTNFDSSRSQVGLSQRRPTQVDLWAADKLFSYILSRNLSKIEEKMIKNTYFSLNSESSLGRTKFFLGRRLDAPVSSYAIFSAELYMECADILIIIIIILFRKIWENGFFFLLLQKATINFRMTWN